MVILVMHSWEAVPTCISIIQNSSDNHNCNNADDSDSEAIKSDTDSEYSSDDMFDD